MHPSLFYPSRAFWNDKLRCMNVNEPIQVLWIRHRPLKVWRNGQCSTRLYEHSWWTQMKLRPMRRGSGVNSCFCVSFLYVWNMCVCERERVVCMKLCCDGHSDQQYKHIIVIISKSLSPLLPSRWVHKTTTTDIYYTRDGSNQAGQLGQTWHIGWITSAIFLTITVLKDTYRKEQQ